ncbi:rCG20567 [Rattus norvegicus]|uniref:RCG20567 n=1 Tax=Rattus norvegicus TaxID=10116 RepID=A6K5I7_RAT|nr:rCG20567 [Rattus norvegicus]
MMPMTDPRMLWVLAPADSAGCMLAQRLYMLTPNLADPTLADRSP